MTGPEHYAAAEQLGHEAAHQVENHSDWDAAQAYAAMAQVHATLALAAATAMSAPLDGEAESGLPPRDAAAWYAAAGVKPGEAR
ncbi:hypothetical protein [Streptomyces sp. NRRL B-24720]|uniref:hypothetical protein n=1 Tax=Streptomyces sp. NRRL B-24720 TaxID=1476876 RepID=UPI000569BB6D|nr:hypothetical protein [Streptomyces sp. NRRL B-24720]